MLPQFLAVSIPSPLRGSLGGEEWETWLLSMHISRMFDDRPTLGQSCFIYIPLSIFPFHRLFIKQRLATFPVIGYVFLAWLEARKCRGVGIIIFISFLNPWKRIRLNATFWVDQINGHLVFCWGFLWAMFKIKPNSIQIALILYVMNTKQNICVTHVLPAVPRSLIVHIFPRLTE